MKQVVYLEEIFVEMKRRRLNQAKRKAEKEDAMEAIEKVQIRLTSASHTLLLGAWN